MKEIDINIEGYNVNGICVGCLNYNRKMFYINEAPDCFRILANIDVPSGLSIQLCWECIAAVKNTLKFRDQILKAYDILNNYSQKHTFLNSPHDLSQYATTRLSIETYSNDDVNSNFCVIKEETFLKEELEMDVVKTELLKDTFDISVDDDPYIKYESYDAPIQDTQSSDDDTYLADLKKTDTQKEKKDKKKKRLKTKTKARHLKNLPSDIVEVYTMTNDELVAVRNKDSTSDEFMSLKYKCMDCVRSFNSQKSLDCHMNGKHVKKDTKTSQCDICKSYFTSKEHMSVHRNRHLNAFKCMKCGFATTLKRIMMNHECMKNSEEFACTECDRTFSWRMERLIIKNVLYFNFSEDDDHDEENLPSDVVKSFQECGKLKLENNRGDDEEFIPLQVVRGLQKSDNQENDLDDHGKLLTSKIMGIIQGCDKMENLIGGDENLFPITALQMSGNLKISGDDNEKFIPPNVERSVKELEYSEKSRRNSENFTPSKIIDALHESNYKNDDDSNSDDEKFLSLEKARSIRETENAENSRTGDEKHLILETIDGFQASENRENLIDDKEFIFPEIVRALQKCDFLENSGSYDGEYIPLEIFGLRRKEDVTSL